MRTYREFKCDYCRIQFKRELRQCHKQSSKHTFCSKACCSAYHDKRHTLNCNSCGKEFIKSNAEFTQSANHFCSHSCNATFNNALRDSNGYSTKNKTKEGGCYLCNDPITVSLHCPADHKLICIKCQLLNNSSNGKKVENTNRPQYLKKKYTSSCQECNLAFSSVSKTQRFCSSQCAHKNESVKNVQSIKAVERVLSGQTKSAGGIRCKFTFNNNKIRCDSLLEYACLTYFVETYNVMEINRCQFSIDCELNGHNFRYVPDFIITTNNTKYLIECKSWVGKSLNEKLRGYLEKSPIKKAALEEYAASHCMVAIWFSPKNSEYCHVYKRIQKEFNEKEKNKNF